jgi:ADP-heptose:LPS heptosyltransferase
VTGCKKVAFGKRLEIFFKRGAARILRAFLAQPPRAPQPPFSRILFIRYGGIGDMILSLPVFRAARARFPDARIDVLCDRKNLAPLLGSGLADRIDVFHKRPWRILATILRLRRRNYEYICNLIVYPSFTFGILARLSGPRALRAAGNQERFAYLYNRPIDLPPKREIHMLKRLFLLAQDIAGPEISGARAPWVEYDAEIKTKARALFEAVSIAPGKSVGGGPFRLAAVNLSAGLTRREWPLEKYTLFLRQAAAKFHDSIDGWVIFTDPECPGMAGELARAVSDERVTVLPAQRDFRVIMEFLRHVHVLVTPDTSFSHAASAMGTPVLVLIIGENLTAWNPLGVPHQIVASEDPVSLRGVEVELVLEKFESLMRLISLKSNVR